jgi:UDP-N-acetylmuramate--alanine ligase
MYYKVQHIHFIGIGGSGMSGIAEVLLNLGYRVTGSDLQHSESVGRLEALGGKIFIGHRAENIGDAQVAVYSSAVSPDNPEVEEARSRHIPVIPRAEMLAELMRLKYGIAVAGAHGKTTTTSLVSSVLAAGGVDPTSVIGGKFNRFGGHSKLGQGDFLVAEADESDGSFLALSPTIAVVTSIDREHLDHYKNLEAIQEAFLTFLNKVPFYGLGVLCLDQENVQSLLPNLRKRYVTYGMTTQADLAAEDVTLERWSSAFSVRHRERDLGRFTLPIPGVHNIYNALAAIAVGLEIGIDPEAARSSLAEFPGVERRFQLVGEKAGITVIDDYGHHPTEIKATLAAARIGCENRLIAVFQPHRYSRTRDLLKEFSTAFNEADSLVLMAIYPGGERPIEGVTGEKLFEAVRQHGHREVQYLTEPDAIVKSLHRIVRRGDVVVTLGAGDVWKVGKSFLGSL